MTNVTTNADLTPDDDGRPIYVQAVDHAKKTAAHVAKARQWIERAQAKLNRAITQDRDALKLLNEALVELNLAEGKEPYEGLGFTRSPRAESGGSGESGDGDG